MAKRIYRKIDSKGSTSVSCKMPNRLMGAMDRHAKLLKLTRSAYIHAAVQRMLESAPKAKPKKV